MRSEILFSILVALKPCVPLRTTNALTCRGGRGHYKRIDLQGRAEDSDVRGWVLEPKALKHMLDVGVVTPNPNKS